MTAKFVMLVGRCLWSANSSEFELFVFFYSFVLWLLYAWALATFNGWCVTAINHIFFVLLVAHSVTLPTIGRHWLCVCVSMSICCMTHNVCSSCEKTTSEKMQNAFGFGFRANASQSDGLFMWVSECMAQTILNFNIFGICLVPFHWSRMLTYRIRHTHKYKQMKSFCAWLDTFKIGKVLNIYFPFEWPESRRCSATRWPAGFSIGWKILMAILLRIFELCRERERENSKAMGNNFSVATFDFGVYMRYIHAVAAKYVWRGLRNLLVGLAYVGR